MKSLLKTFLPWRIVNLFWHLPKSVLASIRYGFPARRFTCIAIAGTKGKTSTAYFLSRILDGAGVKNILFSTAVLKIAGDELPNPLKLTSPTPFFLQKNLRTTLKKGCTHAVIEVSSHAIKQYRVWGIPFAVVVLTNLLSDHLEYHADANEYRSIHTKLISKKTKRLILNADDPNEKEFLNIPAEKDFISKNSADYAELESLHIPIANDYNAMNILMAAKAAQTLGISHETILHILPTLKNAPGRMEYIRQGQPFDVIVDYAHSVDSLSAFFRAVKSRATGRIIAVFGACGDRDPSMRESMGHILDENADSIVITTDDPYSEDPKIIAGELISGIVKKNTASLFDIPDRRAAITQALSLAQCGDTVCILGKGAETVQVLKNKKIPFDDRTVARELLNKTGFPLSRE